MPWFDSLKSRFRSKPTSSPKKHNAEQLRTQLDESRVLMDSLHKRMKKRCEQLQKAHREAADAKDRGQKDTAMFYLKHKRMIEQDQRNLHGQLLNVTKSVQSLEQAMMSTQTMQCLRNTADTLQHASDGHVLDGAEAAADDFDEACDTTAEFADALSAPLGDQPSEHDLEDDFDRLNALPSAGSPVASRKPRKTLSFSRIDATRSGARPAAPARPAKVTEKRPASLKDMERLAALS